MTALLVTLLLWFCALGCGLLGGLYFAFSAFIMSALERVGPAQGSAAMNSINTTILRSAFMPLFFGTSAGSAVLALIGILNLQHSMDFWTLAGGVTYVFGMLGVTMARNVPLNNALLRAGAERDGTWKLYLQKWTRWNHVRTVASVVASACFIAAIASG